jgi:hypothetical protein
MTVAVFDGAEPRFAGWPLCRRYIAANFEMLAIPVLAQLGSRNVVIQWAIGHLRDHECEVFGVWRHSGLDAPPGWGGNVARCPTARPVPGPSRSVWRDVLDDVRHRGVERIQFAISSDLLSFREAVRSCFP